MKKLFKFSTYAIKWLIIEYANYSLGWKSFRINLTRWHFFFCNSAVNYSLKNRIFQSFPFLRRFSWFVYLSYFVHCIEIYFRRRFGLY